MVFSEFDDLIRLKDSNPNKIEREFTEITQKQVEMEMANKFKLNSMIKIDINDRANCKTFSLR